MAFNVRIFGYKGIIQVQQTLLKQWGSDSVFLLSDPYEWSQVLSVVDNGSGAAVASAVAADPDRAQLLYVQLPSQKSIRYEVNPNGPLASNARVAGNSSPMLTGWQTLPWGKGYTISICDAAAFA